MRVVDDQGIGTLDGEEGTGCIAERLREVVVLTAAVGMTIVAYIDTTTFLTGIARGTATQEATLDVHVGRSTFVRGLGVVAFTVHVDIRITRNIRSSEGATLEITEVTTSPNVVGQKQLAGLIHILVFVAEARSAIGGIQDGLLTHEDVDRTVGLAEVTGGIHLLVDLTSADVDHRTHGFLRSIIARE